MLWANMQLHMAADPQALIAQWQQALEVDGFLMFSCLGPDTLRELRAVYAALGWPPPAHEFTDMHDWGDMLVASGFAEPVIDMERITLSCASWAPTCTRRASRRCAGGPGGCGWKARSQSSCAARTGSSRSPSRSSTAMH
jgi:malonyl-CoA O-methyltransferase